MKKTYKVLILTDHSGHSVQNSMYSIVNEIVNHELCYSIHVASRGLKENNLFFEHMYEDALMGSKITAPIQYTQDGSHFRRSLEKLKSKQFDLVLMRLPRPVSDEFLKWLDRIFQNAIIINNPIGIINTSNKKYLLNFPSLCRTVRACYDVNDVLKELEKYPIVLKPLKEYGGRGILKINKRTIDDGLNSYQTEKYLESLSENFPKEGYISMKFMKNVSQGDKRILVVDGDVLGCSLRMPKEDSWLCNVAQGGRSLGATLDDEERHIIEKINPKLKREGILIYGVDTLVNDSGRRVLSEINTLSVGGFPQVEMQTGNPVISIMINKIFRYVDEQRK